MKPSILLLAGDDLQADAIMPLLSRFKAYHCRVKEEAVALCRSRQFCLVLIIEDSPSLDGRVVYGQLRLLQPALVGILLSTSVDNERYSSALEAGFSALLAMPVNEAQLLRLVNQAMERYQLQQENIRLRTLIPLYSLGEQFFSATTESQVLDGLLDAVNRQTGATHISVMLYDEQDGCLHVIASRGMDEQLASSIRLHPGDQIAGWVFQRGKPVILNREDQEASVFAPLLKQPDIVSAISFPLQIRKRIIGVLNISQKETDERFSDADSELLAVICSQAAVALENVRTLQQLAATTRMRTLFEQYVAPEVAELLIAQKSDLMKLGAIETVTVLFADIRNFTRLVQHVDLQSLRSFLNEFFQFFTEAVFHHHGTVDKFMGDAVLAVFGAPIKVAHPNLEAVRAAWSIRHRFQELRDRWGASCANFQEVDLGIAVTTGKVFLGNIGSARRLDYTVIGNDVNIAQRLAGESQLCRIYTTEAVQSEVRQWFEVEELGMMPLRGVEKLIRVFSISRELE